jgi:hypothetical protein
MTRSRDTADTQDNLGGAVAPFVAGKNGVINGGMDIWQRGTSFAITASSFSFYGPDRWNLYSGASGRTASRQVTNDTTNLPNIQYCARIQRDSGNTATNFVQAANMFETVNTIPFVGKTITYSFYARAGANFSAASSVLGVQFITGTGVDQSINVYTGVATPINSTVTLTTTWQRFTFTLTLATTVTELAVSTYYYPVGTAGAADYYEVTGVQLEIGAVATPFARAGGSIGGELALCQRYYWRFYGTANASFGLGVVVLSGYSITSIQNPVELRITPSSLDINNLSFYEPIAAINYTADTIIAPDCTKTVSILRFNKSTLTNVGRVGYLNGDGNSFIGFSAEL